MALQSSSWDSAAERAFQQKCQYATEAQRAGEQLLSYFRENADYFGLDRRDLVVVLRPKPKSFVTAREKVDDYARTKGITPLHAIIWWLNDLAAGRLVVMECGNSKTLANKIREHFHSREAESLTVGSNQYRLWPDNSTENIGDRRPPGYEVLKLPNGYSAVHQLISIRLQNERGGQQYPFESQYPFEIQFMDVLEHLWERIHSPAYHLPSIATPAISKKLQYLKKRCDELRELAVKVDSMIRERTKRRR